MRGLPAPGSAQLPGRSVPPAFRDSLADRLPVLGLGHPATRTTHSNLSRTGGAKARQRMLEGGPSLVSSGESQPRRCRRAAGPALMTGQFVRASVSPISPAGIPTDRESRLTAVGNSGWRRWLPTVTRSGRPGRPIVERVVDRVRCSISASCAMCAIGRAICAASASGAVERVSRNEQVVGSIPTGGSLSCSSVTFIDSNFDGLSISVDRVVDRVVWSGRPDARVSGYGQ